MTRVTLAEYDEDRLDLSPNQTMWFQRNCSFR
jgi:hypothetical protein